MARKKSFNPTLVRLRHALSLAKEILLDLFQSHAGSIEAHPELPR